MAPKNYVVLDAEGIKILIADWICGVEQILSRFQYLPIEGFNQWINATKKLLPDDLKEYSVELLEEVSDSYDKAAASLNEPFEKRSDQKEQKLKLQKALDEALSFIGANIGPEQIVKNLRQTLETELKNLDFKDELGKVKRPFDAFDAFEIDIQESAGPFVYSRKFEIAVERLKKYIQEPRERVKEDFDKKIKGLFESVEKRLNSVMHIIERQLQEPFTHIKTLEAVKEYLSNLDDTVETDVKQMESLLQELSPWNKKVKENLRLFEADKACLKFLEELEEPDSSILSDDDKETLESLFGKYGPKLSTRLKLGETGLNNTEATKAKIRALYQNYQKRIHTASSKFRPVYEHACERFNGGWEALQGENDD